MFVFAPGAVAERAAANFTWAGGLAHWAAVDGVPGRNHLLLMPSCLKLCDQPGELTRFGPPGDALVASATLWHGTYRRGFDVVLPQPFTEVTRALFARQRSDDRPLLVTFKGTISRGATRQKLTPWYAGRAIASEWAHDPARGVVVDVKLKTASRRSACAAYEPDAAAWPYVDLVARSRFGFAPGGAGPYSFRFHEVLAGGAIPVVTDDLVLPWDGFGASGASVRWDECVVRVSHAELYALRAVLGAVEAAADGELARRRAACARIWSLLTANHTAVSDPFEAFAHRAFWTEMRARIRAARAGRTAQS